MRVAALIVAIVALAYSSASPAYEAIRMPTTHYHYDIGVAALDEKDYARAIDNLKLVVKDEPRNADAHDWLGFAFAQAGEREAALRHLREAIRLDPKHLRAHQHLGEFYVSTGDLKRARETLAALRRLCTSPCDELPALERAVGAAR